MGDPVRDEAVEVLDRRLVRAAEEDRPELEPRAAAAAPGRRCKRREVVVAECALLADGDPDAHRVVGVWLDHAPKRQGC